MRRLRDPRLPEGGSPFPLLRSPVSGLQSPASSLCPRFARWSNFRGDTGPWSSPVSMTIAA
jgi:hypothetical protein